MIGALLAVDFLVFVTWEVMDPLEVVKRETHIQVSYLEI